VSDIPSLARRLATLQGTRDAPDRPRSTKIAKPAEEDEVRCRFDLL